MAMFLRRTSASSLILAVAALGCSSMGSGGDASSALMGSWRLVSFETEAQGSGARSKPMGNTPTGYLSFMNDGRMAVVITGEGRKSATSEQERAALLSSLVAYGGVYRVEGDKFITKVDVASNPALVGTEQARWYKIVGNTLQESSDWIRRVDGTTVRVFNTFERVK